MRELKTSVCTTWAGEGSRVARWGESPPTDDVVELLLDLRSGNLVLGLFSSPDPIKIEVIENRSNKSEVIMVKYFTCSM